VIGVIPDALQGLELGHEGLSELVVVETMHERKQRMLELSDASVTLPGGIGSLDELFDSLALLQLRYHSKPVGIANVEGFYDPLLAQLDRATKEGFVLPPQRDMIVVEDTPARVVDALEAWRAPSVPLWNERDALSIEASRGR